MDIVLVIGIFISFFQFVLLQSKASKMVPDKLLSLWMLVLGIHLVSYYIYSLGYWEIYPHLIGITAPVPLFYGPILYLYVLTSLKKNAHLRKQDFIHFAPLALSYLYMSPFFFFYSEVEKKRVDSAVIQDFDSFSVVLLISFIISGIGYSIASYRLLKKHELLINANFSNTEGINLNWLKSFILSMGLIFLTITIVVSLRDFIGLEFSFNLDNIFYSMIVFAVLIMGYYGIRHQNIFIDNVIVDVVDSNSKVQYEKSSLSEDKAIAIRDSLIHLMKKEKPFLEPKLTLSILAEKLETSPNHLSQVINVYESQNFNDFVNTYRINEFIDRARENPNYSYLAHALDSGFNSKSSFNGVFKKLKGITPSQFMSSNLSQ